MLKNDEQLQTVVEAVRSAALGVRDWDGALALAADACGATSLNLVGVEDGRFQFSWAANIDPAMWEDLGDSLHTEQNNPRLALGSRLSVFQLGGGVDFGSDEMIRRYPVYGEVCRKYEVGHGLQMNLEAGPGQLVGVAALNNRATGHGTAADRTAFIALAPYLLDAVRLRRAVEIQGALFASHALEAAGAAAFLCDGGGRVRQMTPRAESLLGPGGPLTLRSGQLCTDAEGPTRRLHDAIGSAARDPLAPHRVISLNSPGQWSAVEVAPLPVLEASLGFAPRVIITVRRRRGPPPSAAISAMFGLTRAEADIARALADGETRAAIAASRGVSLQTIQGQLKAIYHKLGVSREGEMIARINAI